MIDYLMKDIPNTLLLMFMVALVSVLVIALWRLNKNKNKWKSLAGEYHLAYCFKALSRLEQRWAIVGVKKVRKESAYAPDVINENIPSLESKDSAFEPMPSQRDKPEKLPAKDEDYELALVLASNDTVDGRDKLKVLVVRPTDIDKIDTNMSWLAIVEAWPDSSGTGWEFDIRKSVRGSGALSHALDYVVDRAKAEKASFLKARLTHRWHEAHRRRLCYFYADKYGFTHSKASGMMTKDLQ